jgi:type I restriction enzyme, S subunit
MEVSKGYKHTEIGVIPDDWEVKVFGDIVHYIKGFPFRSKDYQQDGIRIIRVSDTTFDSIKKENAIYIDEKRKNEFQRWVLNEFDLIFSTVGSKPPMYDSMVGKVILIKSENTGCFLNQNAVLIRAKNKTNSIQNLLLNHFRTKRYLQHIEEIYRGNANQASITLEDLFKFPIPLPPTLAEQTAIATALSDTDSYISSLEKLIAKKRLIKQGAMQELLKPKDGWVVKNLGEIAEIYTGKKNNQDKVENGQYPFFVRSQTVERINTYSFEGEAILIPGEGNIGKIFHYINGKFDFHQRVYKISDFKDGYNGKYIYRYMSEYFGKHAMENSVKATVDSLRLPTFQVFEIPFPPLLETQIRIATILSDMDSGIAALETKLEKARHMKQGMMQQLLTGKIRLV